MLLTFLLDEDCDDDSVVALYQLGDQVVKIKQRPDEGNIELDEEQAKQASHAPPSKTPNVGWRVWSSNFAIAELLFRERPAGAAWSGVKVLDLGCGTGLFGIALAMAGARVTMTDLPHVTPLALDNVASNASLLPHPPVVHNFVWGEDPSCLGGPFDIIVGCELLYEPEYFDGLLQSICQLSAPHTVIWMGHVRRNLHEESFDTKAEAAGFSLRHIPKEELGEAFQTGKYRVLRMEPREWPLGVAPSAAAG